MKLTASVLIFLIVSLSMLGCRVQSYPPELVRLSTPSGPVDGTLTLTGYQFGNEPAVLFSTTATAGNPTLAPVRSSDDNTIVVTIPGVAPGQSIVRVRNSQGTSEALPFLVNQPAPVLVSVSPGNGLQGSTVVVTGSYLNQVKWVRLGGIDVAVSDSTAQKITFKVPTDIPRGSQLLSIETVSGNITTAFIVAGTPQITSISPTQAKPGSELIVRGKNLLDGVVSINGLNTDKNATTIQDTEIRTIIPTNAQSGRVTVTVFEKLVATATDSLKIIQAPFITHLLAADGFAGERLIIEGNNLRFLTTLTFGGVNVPYQVLNDTQLAITLPALPASGSVTITGSGIGGTTTAQDPFFFFLRPSNITFSPTRLVRGTQLVVSGKDMYRISDVRVNGYATTITTRTEGSSVQVIVPVEATSGPVVVTSRAGSATSASPLTIVQTPVITDLLPTKARVGERVVLRGTSLLDAKVLFYGSLAAAAEGGKNTDAERWVLVPSDAQTGVIRVVNAVGETFTSGSFTVVRLPTISEFAPKALRVGEEVAIYGLNLPTVTAVKFNGGTLPAASFRFVGNVLYATVPTGAKTDQICLTNEAGVLCTTSNVTINP